MRYMLLIYGDENGDGDMSEAEQQADAAGVVRVHRGAARGRRDAGRRRAAADHDRHHRARRRRRAARHRRPVRRDASEQLGGYYLLDVADLDEAIKWAHKCPGARTGTIELRPVMEFDS